MTSTRPRSTRLQALAVLTATASLLAACGGDSDGAADASDDAVTATSSDTASTTSAAPPSTDPPVTEPTTDPDTTEPTDPDDGDPELPAWASGEMVTVGSDTGPLEIPVELAPFCESSRSFFVAAKALDYVEEDQLGTAQQLFAALAALVPMAIETAPSDDFAARPTAARYQLAVLIPAFEEAGYDGAGLRDLADPDPVFEAVAGFAETRSSLQDFLVEACGADEGILAEQGRGAAAAAAAAAGETVEPEEPVEAAAGELITNERSTIEVSVPVEWAATEESRRNERDTLAASTDLEAFAGLTAPGVLVLRGEGGFRDGGFVGRVLEFEADLQEAGCVTVDELDYADSTYDGQERIYDCGIDGLDVRLFGGATADESLYAMVLLVNPVDQPGLRQLIVDSFFVK